MLLGIDVGGTFTDAVIIDDNRVLASAKNRTTHGHLMDGILASLDQVLAQPSVQAGTIEQVTLSTTVVTNAIVSHHIDPVDLYIVPGPGMNMSGRLPVEPVIVKGYTDHRGMMQERITAEDFNILVDQNKQAAKAAVSAKFAVRNPKEENRLVDFLQEKYDFVSAGASLSGALNFPRRTVSAYYNSAVESIFVDFKANVEDALVNRGIDAPIYILKADGGSLPMDAIIQSPVETVFTGPAASVLGLMALQGMMAEDGHVHHMAVALDIGGTTTDISLWKDGKPLMTQEGVLIDGYPSSIRSFLVQSIGVAGETALRKTSHGVTIGPDRVGSSVAAGGSVPTVGDALIALNHAHFGNEQAAIQSLEDNGILADEVARVSVALITQAIDQMVAQANRQPIYVVEDLVNPHVFQPDTLVLIGGSAQAFKPILEQYTDYKVVVPQEAAVANAIGACLARHTLELTVHVDTKRALVTVPELGLQEENQSILWGQAAKEYGFDLLRKQADRLGLLVSGMECTFLEDFPVVEGWGSSHRMITARVQLEAGVTGHVTSRQ